MRGTPSPAETRASVELPVDYRSIVESSPDIIARFDREYRCVYVNRAAEPLVAAIAPLAKGRRFPWSGASATITQIWERGLERVFTAGEPHTIELRCPVGEGVRDYQVFLTPERDGHDAVRSVMAIARDITDLTAAKAARDLSESRVRLSEERFQTAFVNAAAGMFVASPDGRLLDVNRALCDLTGRAREELVGSSVASLVRLEGPSAETPPPGSNIEAFRRAVDGREFRIERADSAAAWVRISFGIAPDETGQPMVYVGLLDDVTARRLAEERLLRDVLYDKLTGLPNRALLMERLEHAAARARRNPDHPFAVLFIDLDNFKVVNDSLGHAIGDQLLVRIARRLVLCLRADDTLARLGGDEFVVLTGDLTGPGDACDLADRIQKELRAPFSIESHEMFKTASIGIASSSTSDESCENLLRDADTAMYRAKMRGKGCYEVFSDSMHQEAVQRLQLESDLRSALANGEFRVYYQPIISARTGDITGVEALLRWQHATRGLLGPAEFLSIADEIGLMVPIGEWVLRTACAEVKAWEERGLSRVRVGVNISAGQFREPALGDVIEAALRDSGLDPRDLELELTEHIVFSSAPPTVAALKRLTDLGTRLAVDDFGLVHSSLRYMLRVPLASLKIDKSFIHDISTDQTGPTVMKALIALGHTLGLNVVAEGVETEEQDRFLVRAGCDELQGFFGGVPLRPEDVRALLASQSAVEPLHSLQAH